MAEKKPTNIIEAIFYGVEVTNESVHTLSENLNEIADKVAAMQGQMNTILAFFNQPAPEKPNVLGEDGVVTEKVGDKEK